MAAPRLRRLARERALQFLFGLDFTGYDWEPEAEDFWALSPSRPGVRSYAERLVRGVCQERRLLDELIAPCLDQWRIDRLGCVERNVLRMALFEMRFVEDVPTAVAINEAIEVARRFGSDEAPRFVNGVLDRLRRTIADDTEEALNE